MESSTVIQANSEEGQPNIAITESQENAQNQDGTTALVQGDSFVQNLSESVTDNITVGAVTDGEPSQEQVEVGSDHSDTGWETDLEIEEEKEEFDVSGKKVYLKACETMGIIPASYFVRNIQETQIIMPHHGIGGKGAKAIAVALVSNTTISTLNLADNGIGGEGAIAIADMLKDNCYVTKLDISDNGIEAPGAYAMAEMLKYNTTITECYLKGSHFDDKSADIIADIIRGNLHLTCLDLSYNELGDNAGQIIGPAIGQYNII